MEIGDRPAVVPLVIEDMKERLALGIRRYGVPVYPHNGRDALLDAYEEALDLAIYLKQALLEQAARQEDAEVAGQVPAGIDDVRTTGLTEAYMAEINNLVRTYTAHTYDGSNSAELLGYCTALWPLSEITSEQDGVLVLDTHAPPGVVTMNIGDYMIVNNNGGTVEEWATPAQLAEHFVQVVPAE